MNVEESQIIALQALTWLAGNDELCPMFMGATGVSEADFRQRASEPEFLGSVLDFVLMDDAWVVGCADALQMAPEDLARARSSLPGGEQVHWT